jgi:hypothetical protein
MQDATIVAWIREKFQALEAELDERGTRRWAATEARSLGCGLYVLLALSWRGTISLIRASDPRSAWSVREA